MQALQQHHETDLTLSPYKLPQKRPDPNQAARITKQEREQLDSEIVCAY